MEESAWTSYKGLVAGIWMGDMATCCIPSILQLISLSSQIPKDFRSNAFSLQCNPVRIIEPGGAIFKGLRASQ